MCQSLYSVVIFPRVSGSPGSPRSIHYVSTGRECVGKQAHRAGTPLVVVGAAAQSRPAGLLLAQHVSISLLVEGESTETQPRLRTVLDGGGPGQFACCAFQPPLLCVGVRRVFYLRLPSVLRLSSFR